MDWIAIVLLILLVIFISHSRKEKKGDPELNRLQKKLKLIVREAGFSARFRLSQHPRANYTQGKQNIYICTSCVEQEEKLLYIGLHEIAHVLCKTSHGKDSHDERWKAVFFKLLQTAAHLGYLDANKIRSA